MLSDSATFNYCKLMIYTDEMYGPAPAHCVLSTKYDENQLVLSTTHRYCDCEKQAVPQEYGADAGHSIWDDVHVYIAGL